LFGLATSLGFGVQQIAAGLNFLIGIPDNAIIQVILIAAITACATMSVVSGLDAGVRRLSELNIYIAAIFMAFIILAGPTLFILGSFVQNLGYYASMFPTLSFWTETFEGTNWQNGWTVFYWGWWISWSPFVGVFIARISRGRTVREFILGVLFLPSLLSFLWMSAFGGSALFLELNGISNVTEAVNENVATALFIMLENFPLTALSSLIGVILVVTFFVTSSDSGSLVVDSLTSGGNVNSPVPQRVFWAVMEGVVAAALLLGGGLGALQTASITTGLPFAIVLLVMCYSLYRGLNHEHARIEAQQLKLREEELEAVASYRSSS
jgi:choline/glycine/proline betaine transport protein